MCSSKSLRFLLLSAALFLSACGGDDEARFAQGSVSVGVTDAPIDRAAAVMIDFERIEFQPVDGEKLVFALDDNGPINVLELHGGVRELLLKEVEVPAGRYSYMRLIVSKEGAGSTIEFEDGGVFPLTVPSGRQTGLKLNGGMVVPENGHADLTVDFDLRRSIHERSAGSSTDYILRPTLRLVQTDTTGSIAGRVDTGTAAGTECDPAVYVYEGLGIDPDDMGSPVEPVSSARVSLDASTGEYRYHVSYLVEGEYTAAFTCDAADDAPDTDDDIRFEGATGVTVDAGETVSADF